MAPRQPNRWTSVEDGTLYQEAMKQAASGTIKDWNCIAEKLPGRSNKDCRKRWINNVCGGLKRGPWSAAEDETLRAAVESHGQRWTRVAAMCGGRSPDQCAKRWQFRLDPKLEHREWTAQEDELLLSLVRIYGRDWKLICHENYPTRSRNDLKNRYATLSRRSLSEESTSDSTKDHTHSSHAHSAEQPMASPPGSLTNDPTLSECPNLDGASPIWTANEQCEADPSYHNYDGELDLDMDFYSDANLFDPSPCSSGRADDMGTEIPDGKRSGSVPMLDGSPPLHLSPVMDPSLDLDPASLCSYGGDVSQSISNQPNQLSVASTGCSIFEASPAQLEIERTALSQSLNGRNSLDILNLHAAAVMPPVVDGDSSECRSGIASAVSRVVLVVEECDPDMVNYLIDITGRLKGKVKMEMTI